MRVVLVNDDSQRTCPHHPVTLIEQPMWDEQICGSCAALIYDCTGLDHDDAVEFYRLATDAGLNPEIR